MKKNFNVTKPHYGEQKIYQSLGTSLYRDSTVVVIILLTLITVKPSKTYSRNISGMLLCCMEKANQT